MTTTYSAVTEIAMRVLGLGCPACEDEGLGHSDLHDVDDEAEIEGRRIVKRFRCERGHELKVVLRVDVMRVSVQERKKECLMTR